MTTSGRDTTMDWLMQRSLANAPGSGQVCPPPEILATYYEGSLDSAETARFESHVSQCAVCREQLAMMVRAEETPQPAPNRSWLGDWRLIASAAAALLILTVWAVRRSAPAVGSAATPPLVAMSHRESSPSSQPPSRALNAPEELDRLAPKAQGGPSQQQPAPQNEIPNLPRNGHNEDLRVDLGPPVKAAPGTGRSELAKKEEEAKNVSPSISLQATPALPPAAAATPVGGLGESPNDAPAASDAKAAGAANLKQMETAPRAKAFGAATGGALGQVATQRSASTIIQTPDPKVMWRIAGGNFVERTEDGGASWRGQVADPDALLTSGSAPSPKICWLVGKSGMILVTKDTTHWKKIPPPVPADFVSVEAKNGSSATVVATDGQKFSTDNDGKKWVPASHK
jgi:hypothetical protein